jgi:hypothetical protein
MGTRPTTKPGRVRREDALHFSWRLMRGGNAPILMVRLADAPDKTSGSVWL